MICKRLPDGKPPIADAFPTGFPTILQFFDGFSHQINIRSPVSYGFPMVYGQISQSALRVYWESIPESMLWPSLEWRWVDSDMFYG